MNLLILGAGEVGLHIAELFCAADHNVCLIESNAEAAAIAGDKLDARVIVGNGISVSVIEEAGVADCDVFFAVSASDPTNLVAASLAKALGADQAVCRVHADLQQEQWLFDLRQRFDVDYLFSTERISAIELAKHIRNPDALAVEEFAGGRIELQQVSLPAESPAVRKSLKDLALPSRVRVGAIERQGRTIVPGADTTLEAGDLVTLFGSTRNLETAAELFRAPKKQQDEVRVVIFGGGGYGFALAQMLEGKRFRTRIFETDPKRCEFLSGVLQRTTLINADATSIQQLREEQIGEADFFVGATNDDEDNVMTCLQAQDLGVKHCLALIHRADYADAIMRAGKRLGILGAVSPRIATGRDLIRFATTERLHSLITLAGDIEVVEFAVREGSPLANRRVDEISWPSGCGLVSLTHGSSASVPAADDQLQPGNLLAAMVSPEGKRELARMIT